MDKRIKELGVPYSKDVYHYTKLSNLFGIITENGLVFHAGRYDSMNDPNDSVFLTFCENIRRFQNGEYDIFGDFGTGEVKPFLVSFSCDCDNPIMWRLYDANVCLHINPQVVYEYCKGKGCQFTRMDTVSYAEKIEDHPEFKKKMQELSSCVAHGQSEYDAEVCFSFCKHKDFSVENEWRLACFEKDEICSDIKVKGIKYGSLYYYREIYLPKDCLAGITIRTYDDKTYSLLSDLIKTQLNQYGYADSIEIKKTKTAEVR